MSVDLEQRVDRALAGIELGRFAGPTDLYDLMSQSVYLLARTITDDEDTAQQVTMKRSLRCGRQQHITSPCDPQSTVDPRYRLSRARATENRVSVALTR
jgi:hypothetical protein